MGVRVNLIINEDMSRGVTVAEDRQTGGSERTKRAVTYFDMNCCESKCQCAVGGVEVFRS
jgi:hypothetical protein